MTQLGFDGRETPHPTRRPRPLSDRQREVMRLLRAHDDVRPLIVGMLMHEGREHACACYEGVPCKWASSDGWDALRRLEQRGLVEHVARGRWRAVAADERGWS